MSTEPDDLLEWSKRKWCVVIGTIFLVQFGLMVWAIDRKPIVKREVGAVPKFRLVGNISGDSGMINNPALFALANRKGFSGQAWLRAPMVEFKSAEWTEPLRWLPMPVQKLGESLNVFVATNIFEVSAIPEKPNLSGTELYPPLNLGATQSLVRVEGELASRSVTVPVQAGAIAHTDVLGNTVVQVVVEPVGSVFSAIVVSSSGSKAADKAALDSATRAQFEPRSGPGMMTGRFIFHWLTVPAKPPGGAP